MMRSASVSLVVLGVLFLLVLTGAAWAAGGTDPVYEVQAGPALMTFNAGDLTFPGAVLLGLMYLGRALGRGQGFIPTVRVVLSSEKKHRNEPED